MFGKNDLAMSFLKSLFGGGGKAKTELFTPPPPPPDEAVTRAETVLGIRFPGTFISFMRESCSMQLPLCAEFYWIGDESLGTSNIVTANRREREESASPLPAVLVAFYNDGMGNQVCFDSRHRSEDGEYPIVFWDHELGSEENLDAVERASASSESAGIIASTFPDWLRTIE
jgi:hypothetical protein